MWGNTSPGGSVLTTHPKRSSSSKIFQINLLLYTPGSAMGGVWPSSKTLSRYLSFLSWCKAYVIILKIKAMSSTTILFLVPSLSMCLLPKVKVIKNLQIFLFFFLPKFTINTDKGNHQNSSYRLKIIMPCLERCFCKWECTLYGWKLKRRHIKEKRRKKKKGLCWNCPGKRVKTDPPNTHKSTHAFVLICCHLNSWILFCASTAPSTSLFSFIF